MKRLVILAEVHAQLNPGERRLLEVPAARNGTLTNFKMGVGLEPFVVHQIYAFPEPLSFLPTRQLALPRGRRHARKVRRRQGLLIKYQHRGICVCMGDRLQVEVENSSGRPQHFSGKFVSNPWQINGSDRNVYCGDTPPRTGPPPHLPNRTFLSSPPRIIQKWEVAQIFATPATNARFDSWVKRLADSKITRP